MLNDFAINDKCYDATNIRYNSSYIPSSIKIYSDSKSCDAAILASQKGPSDNLPYCPSHLLEFHVSPTAVLNPGNTYPYMDLNISVTPHQKVSSLFIRLHCVYAPDGEDTYCHGHKEMTVNGVWLWPCRGLSLNGVDVEVPFRFGYGCFRLFAHSQYLINATVYPQKCRSTLLVTAPVDSQLFPSIKEYYEERGSKKETSENELENAWSPMLILDLSDVDGVWFRVQPFPENLVGSVSLRVFRRDLQKDDDSLVLSRSFEVESPYSGVKWHDVPSGDYLVYAYVQRHDCLLICDQASKGCQVCPHTELNFTMAEHRAGFSWRAVRAIRDSGVQLFVFLLCIFAAMTVLGVLYCFYLQRRSKHRTAQELPLLRRIRVLPIYSDDCEEHTKCVSALVEILKNDANSHVFFDAEELNVPGVKPSRWLVDTFCKTDKCLVLVSPCVPELLRLDSDCGEKRRLRQNRPFPDLFVPGVDMVIRECTRVPSSVVQPEQGFLASERRFAVVRFSYSPPTPPQLSALGLETFNLPEHFSRLTAFLHDVNASSNEIVHNIAANRFGAFVKATEDMEEMMKSADDWMESRWDIEEPVTSVTDVVDDISFISKTPAQTAAEAAAEFGILPPDNMEDEEEDDHSNFKLLPPDSDSDSSTT
ncbi:unnamed protein product [Caenorhabditis auriculariae]|uniref:SEFIR domain-containing protein n=1 Tax=Caenorhabditis auriculariae TaxID=2777116 RepID=A0A8S1HNZ0_9PELO|nr:unnamed protein product [Caenorhabditis auriculariae]